MLCGSKALADTNMASSSPLLSPSTLSFILIKNPKIVHFANPFPSTQSSRTKYCYPKLPNAVRPKTTKISATNNGLFLLSEASSPAEISQEIVSTSDDGVATVVSSLLLAAFIGLSILTVGVVYIAVTDFLTKREREKFEKEEAAKKKGGKKGKVRARARGGPRGFGQKIEQDDDDDFDL